MILLLLILQSVSDSVLMEKLCKRTRLQQASFCHGSFSVFQLVTFKTRLLTQARMLYAFADFVQCFPFQTLYLLPVKSFGSILPSKITLAEYLEMTQIVYTTYSIELNNTQFFNFSLKCSKTPSCAQISNYLQQIDASIPFLMNFFKSFCVSVSPG